MHLAIDVAFDVVDHIMHEVLFQSVVANPLVGVDRRVAADFSQNFALQGIAANVWDNLRPHFSHVAVKHTHDDSLVHVVALECAAFDFGHLCALALVHVGDSSTNKGFVYLDSAATFAHLSDRFILHGKTNSVQHEPCSLLCDLQIAGYFVATDTILAVGDEPHCCQPFVESDCGILHHSPDLDGKLALGVMASTLPRAALLAVFDSLRATSRTSYLTVRPAANCEVVNAVVGIREVDYCLLQALWFAHGLSTHEQNRTLNQWTSQVNYYPFRDGFHAHTLARRLSHLFLSPRAAQPTFAANCARTG